MKKTRTIFSAKGSKDRKPLIKFTVQPEFIVFNNYNVSKSSIETINIKNIDKYPNYIKISIVDRQVDLNISVKNEYPQPIQSNQSITVEVEFIATTALKKVKSDRRHSIYVTSFSDGFRFEVPIIISSRNPGISIPKQLTMPQSSLKISTYFIFVIVNMEDTNYHFSLEPVAKDNKLEFHSIVKSFNIKPGESVSIITESEPKLMGDSQDRILLKPATGKTREILIKVKSLSNPITSYRNAINFPDTFINTNSEEKLYLFNRGQQSLEFSWMVVPSNDIKDNFEVNPFVVTPMTGSIDAQSVIEISITFNPVSSVVYYDSNIVLLLSTPPTSITIPIQGMGIGPDIRVVPTTLTVGNLAFGEHKRFEMMWINEGPIPGRISFDRCEGGYSTTSPKTKQLNVEQKAKFSLDYASDIVGDFVQKIFFRIENGNTLSVEISGSIQKPGFQINSGHKYPKLLSICIPHTWYLRLTNNLTTDTFVCVEIPEDGNETPLEFEDIPIPELPYCPPQTIPPYQSVNIGITNVRPVSEQSLRNDEHIHYPSPRISLSSFEWMLHYRQSVYDEEKLNNIVECDPLTTSENINIIECLMTDLVDELPIESKSMLSLNTILNNNKNRDWRLPKFPKEYRMDNARFPLKRNNSMLVQLTIVPNLMGYWVRTLKVGITPIERPEPRNSESSSFVSEIPLRHACIIPDVQLDISLLKDVEAFVEQDVDVNLKVKNTCTDCIGFCYIEQEINESRDDKEIIIKINPKKNIIFPQEEVTVVLTITGLIMGHVERVLKLHTLGDDDNIKPIHLSCNFICPDVKVIPSRIVIPEQPLLELCTHKFVIENIVPTVTRFTLKMLNENQTIECYPKGAQLAPGQAILIEIQYLFTDADTYKNSIIIDIVNGLPKKIPVEITAIGLCLQFTEDIVKDPVDFGRLFTSKEPYSRSISLCNFGARTHNLFFGFKSIKLQKNQPQQPKESINFYTQPEHLTIEHGETKTLALYTKRSGPGKIEDELIVDAVIGKVPKKINLFSTSVKAIFISPCIQWSKKSIDLQVIYDGQESDVLEFLTKDEVTITNCSMLPMEICLQCEHGEYFLIQDEYFIPIVDPFTLDPKASLNLTIQFDWRLILMTRLSICYNSKIKVKANNKVQPNLPLNMTIIYPYINVWPTEIELIACKSTPVSTYFQMSNTGPILAKYEWIFDENSLIKTNLIPNDNQTVKNVAFEILHKTPKRYPVEPFPGLSCESMNESVEEEEEMEIEIEPTIQVVENKKDTKKPISKGKSKIPIIETIIEEISESESSLISSSIEDEEILQSIEEITAILRTTNSALSLDNSSLDELFHELILIDNENDEKEFKSNKYVALCHYTGILNPGDQQTVNIYGIGDLIDLNIKIRLELHIENGPVIPIKVAIVFCEEKIRFNDVDYQFANQPWYNIIRRNLAIHNPNPISIHVQILRNIYINELKSEHPSICGTMKILPECDRFSLAINGSKKLTIVTYLGIKDNFQQEFGIAIGQNIPIRIRVCGEGKIPLLSIVGANPSVHKDFRGSFEFSHLKNFFNRHFKSGTRRNSMDIEPDLSLLEEEEYATGEGEEFSTMGSDISLSDLSIIDNLETSGLPATQSIVDYLQRRYFENHLKQDPSSFKEFKDNYSRNIQGHLNSRISTDYQRSNKPVVFKIIPLPFQGQAYELDYGIIELEETLIRILHIIYNGPGKLNISVRSMIPVPGLRIFFNDPEVDKNDGDTVPPRYTNYAYDLRQDTYDKYKNLIERFEESSSLYSMYSMSGHPHSYDFDLNKIHKRDLTIIDRAAINEYYTNFNSKNKTVKAPNTHAEIFQENSGNSIGQIIDMFIEFIPKRKYYDGVSEFLEVIYIDLHNGPATPIILKGCFDRSPGTSQVELEIKSVTSFENIHQNSAESMK